VELYLHSLPRAFTTYTGINLYFISCVHMTTLPCILVLYVTVNQNTSHFFLIFLLRFAFTCCSMVSHITSVPTAVFTTFSDRLRDATRVTYGTPTALTLTYPEAIPLVFPRVVRYNCSIPARHMYTIKADTHTSNLKFKYQRTILSACSCIQPNSVIKS
jgi:hypothetical protein